MSYTNAALQGMGYTNAALEGMGYTNAALEGMGYTNAALEGFGSTKLKKGSAEAKARMAYLRSLRGKKKGGMINMSGMTEEQIQKWHERQREREAKWRERWMLAHPGAIGAPRLHGASRGGSIIGALSAIRGALAAVRVGKMLARPAKRYLQSWEKDKNAQLAEIERLEKLKKQRGGKFEFRDIRDGLLGPVGWIRMGIRKNRERKIAQLKKELGEA